MGVLSLPVGWFFWKAQAKGRVSRAKTKVILRLYSNNEKVYEEKRRMSVVKSRTSAVIGEKYIKIRVPPKVKFCLTRITVAIDVDGLRDFEVNCPLDHTHFIRPNTNLTLEWKGGKVMELLK